MKPPLHEHVYLASQSPRRAQLLGQIGVTFELLLPRPDEDAEALEAEVAGELPADYVERVTRAKLQAARRRLKASGRPAAPILCSDTTVALGRRIFGKPADAADARGMLSMLAGRTHRVITAVAVSAGTRTLFAHEHLAGHLRGDGHPGRHRALRRRRRSLSTRPAPTRSRAELPPSSRESTAATPVSWALPLFETAHLLRQARVRNLNPSPSRACTETLNSTASMRRHPHQLGARRKRVWPWSSRARCRSCTWSARSTRGLVGNVYARQAWRACCPGCRAPSSTSAWNAPPSCTWPTSGTWPGRPAPTTTAPVARTAVPPGRRRRSSACCSRGRR